MRERETGRRCAEDDKKTMIIWNETLITDCRKKIEINNIHANNYKFVSISYINSLENYSQSFYDYNFYQVTTHDILVVFKRLIYRTFGGGFFPISAYAKLSELRNSHT